MLLAMLHVRARARRAGLIVAGLVALTAALLAAPAMAVTVGPVSHLGNPGASPAIAYNPATGQGLAVWTGPHNGVTGVYGRRVNALGGAISPVVRLSAAVPDLEVSRPAVAFSPRTGKFFVTWGAQSGGGTGVVIRTRTMRITGEVLGGVPGAYDPSRYARYPCYSAPPTALATQPTSGEFLLTYGCREDSYVSTVRGQRMNGDGGPIGGAREYLSTGVTGLWSDLTHAVAANPRTGEFLVSALTGERGDEYDPRVVVRRVAATGAPLDDQRAISDRGGVGQTAVVAHPGTGDYLVLWAGERLLAQRLSSAGAEVGANDLAVLPPGAPDPSSAAVAVNARSGQYLAVAGSDAGVLARPLRADGALLEAGATPITRSATSAVAATSAAGAPNFVAAWDGLFSAAVGTASR